MEVRRSHPIELQQAILKCLMAIAIPKTIADMLVW
jgi:hypothetical protein